MIRYTNVLNQIKTVVDEATRLYAEATDGVGKEGWIVFFEARSFWLAVVGVVFAALAVFGIYLPIPQELVSEAVLQVISFGAFAWSFVERLRGDKEIVWNVKQAGTAIKQAQGVKNSVLMIQQLAEKARKG